MRISLNSESLFAAFFLALLPAFVCSAALIDMDRDGMSDVWEVAFDAQELDPGVDTDGDGQTNLQESSHGTDPFDAQSRFAMVALEARSDGVAFVFDGVENQSYYLEESQNLLDWQAGEELVVSDGGEETLLGSHGEAGVRFMRFRVGADQDYDGISDYEESLLGYDPFSPHSISGYSGGDMAYLMDRFSSGESITIKGQQMQAPKPTMEEASRFLSQAALGANMDEIASVSQMGYGAWIEDQFTRGPGLIEPRVHWWRENDDNVFFVHRRYAWWEQVMSSDDLLRQRMATALGEVYVLSDEALDGGAAVEGMAHFYDMLLRHSFGNWRDILRDVSLHPAMGFYLSHLQNRKASAAENRFPDENFAREVMQLFSIGLFELNPDGSRANDAQGNDIPTYNNEDITNFARVFTGFSYGGPNNSTNVPWQFLFGQWVWNAPMKVWLEEHDTEEKHLLRGTVLPSFADDPGRTPMDDFEDAMDNLYFHPNVGPFIIYRLIQRLVKSNPSPEYVRRVAQVFDDNGQGVRGDMQAVIKAILLDVEARSLAAYDDPHAGRLREPYLRWTRLVKTFGETTTGENYLIPDWSHLEEMGQRIMSSTSVFNFFLPDYVVPGEMADAGLVGPEFQILTSSTAISTQNIYGNAMMWGYGRWMEGNGHLFRFNFPDEIALLNADGLEALIDRLDLLMTHGQLRDDTRQLVWDVYNNRPGWFSQAQSISMMVKVILMSPEYAIFR